jgi:phosphinothricin acetyltransferase
MARIETAGSEHVPDIARMYAVEAERGYATFDVEGLPETVWETRRCSTVPGDVLLVALGGIGRKDGDSAVLGFAWSHPYRPKPAYGSTREATVYVSPAAAGRGIGTALYADLLRRVGATGIHLVVAGIAEPNPASRRLHERAGFSLVGTMTEVGHKFGRYHDVSWWQRRLS